MSEFKTVQLRGLRGNYQNGYAVGEVVYRKYNREWHIYTTTPQLRFGSRTSIDRVQRASNDVEYVEAHPDLQAALKRAAKPVTTINDKVNNGRPSLACISIMYDPSTGNIIGHSIAEGVTHTAEEKKEKLKEYDSITNFGTFLGIATRIKLTFKSSK
jgi:hypothetical protein